jgi:2-dehydropantoate 2-reductase
MKSNPSSILIAGTGAMACLFAARLAGAGIPVVMTGTWPAGLDALEKSGVCLVQADGSSQAYPVQVIREGQACKPARYALVLVKSWQTECAAQRLVKCLASDGLALTLQNGLGNREKLLRALGPGRVALGVTTSGATLLAPGRVIPAGEGVIALNGTPGLEPLGELLKQAGFRVENVADAQALLWGKLVINAAINPLTAVLGIPNGELLDHQETRNLMAELAGEAATVANALGIHLHYENPATAAEYVAQRTAANLSSMLQDIRNGRPTEIDAICGEIVRLGEQSGVPTPLNRVMWQLVKAKGNDNHHNIG